MVGFFFFLPFFHAASSIPPNPRITVDASNTSCRLGSSRHILNIITRYVRNAFFVVPNPRHGRSPITKAQSNILYRVSKAQAEGRCCISCYEPPAEGLQCSRTWPCLNQVLSRRALSTWLSRPRLIDQSSCSVEIPCMNLEQSDRCPRLSSAFTPVVLQYQLALQLSVDSNKATHDPTIAAGMLEPSSHKKEKSPLALLGPPTNNYLPR